MTKLHDRSLHGVAIYNPDLLSKQELIAQFSARTALLNRLLEDLGRKGAGQHHLLIGQRGMGKTTLLRRLRYAVEDTPELEKQWLPLTFPEEQYNVSRLSDLYLNCIDALGDALERSGREDEARKLDDLVARLPDVKEPARAKQALEILLAAEKRTGRRLLLLIDNIDLILDRLKNDQWALREVLSPDNGLLLIGASATMIESTFEYKQPFYDFFQLHDLRGLNEEETRALLRTLSRLGHAPQVERVLEDDPARIRTVHVLAGGNPRTIVLLYNVLASSTEGTVRSDLEQLLDQCTPLYKARFESLPAQSQQIVDALAIHWDPISAGELAALVRLDTNAVSAQLNRLVQQGVVEKVAYHPSSKTGFQVAERFFNIWYLMRASRRVRQRLIWLVEFLRLLYGHDQLQKHAQHHLRHTHGADSDSRLRQAEYGLALAQVLDDAPLRSALESTSMQALAIERDLRCQLASILDLEGADASLKPLADRHRMMAEAREAVLSAKIRWKGWNATQFWDLLGGSFISVGEKHAIATSLSQYSKENVSQLILILENEIEHFTKLFRDEGTVQELREAVRCGHMADLADVEGAEGASLTLDAPGLPAIALALRLEREPDPAGIEKLKEALLRTASPCPWTVLGNLLQVHLKRYEEAEAAYRKAIEIDPAYPYPWNGLGNLLQVHLKRHEEAEMAYRKAIEIDPAYASPWNNLASLKYQTNQVDQETEDSARRALSLDPDDVRIVHTLATILAHQNKWSEAAPLAKRFLDEGSAEFHEQRWPDMLTFFREAVLTHHAAEALALLDALPLADRWRPLREALRAIAEGSRLPLRRVAPEIRLPAEQLLLQLLPEGQSLP